MLGSCASPRLCQKDVENSSSKSQGRCHQDRKEPPIRRFYLLLFLHGNRAQLDLRPAPFLLQSPAPQRPFLYEHKKYWHQDQDMDC